ncbi:hypothetical protein WA026_018352, partial [Henosepilachna vigintioctopunctata]
RQIPVIITKKTKKPTYYYHIFHNETPTKFKNSSLKEAGAASISRQESSWLVEHRSCTFVTSLPDGAAVNSANVVYEKSTSGNDRNPINIAKFEC